MENEEKNLNTEPNDIAGNRIDGPVGNTATRPTAPGTGVGMPGGPPQPQAATSHPAAGQRVGQEAADGAAGQPENQEPDPVTPTGAYGGNFSNSTQDSYHDQNRRDNQDSDANRGEFGVQDQGGTTHGGFGNQNRLADYEPHHSAEDQYYGGPGAPGLQANAYRAYDGRDERPDPRPNYGFEAGTTDAPTSGQAAEAAPTGPGQPNGPHTNNTNQPGRSDAVSAFQNDNGSPLGSDHSYAADYGHTSLPGAVPTAPAEPDAVPRRNQGEDGQSSRGGYDNQGSTGGAANTAITDDTAAKLPLSSQGYGDRGREQPNSTPDYRTGNDRNGYGQSYGGNESQGTGTRGGSYNDAYDDGKPGMPDTSPAQGDLRREDLDANYGLDARQQNRPPEGQEEDHGAPRRNAGRDDTADE